MAVTYKKKSTVPNCQRKQKKKDFILKNNKWERKREAERYENVMSLASELIESPFEW